MTSKPIKVTEIENLRRWSTMKELSLEEMIELIDQKIVSKAKYGKKECQMMIPERLYMGIMFYFGSALYKVTRTDLILPDNKIMINISWDK